VFRSNTTGFIDVFRGERIAPIRVLCFRRVLFRRESHAGVRARSLALRAKDHLHLILPQRFFAHQQKSNGDRHMYASRTRFIPAAILDRFESCAWPETPATTLAAKKATDPSTSQHVYGACGAKAPSATGHHTQPAQRSI
jgi:hypothetical protein